MLPIDFWCQIYFNSSERARSASSCMNSWRANEIKGTRTAGEETANVGSADSWSAKYTECFPKCQILVHSKIRTADME